MDLDAARLATPIGLRPTVCRWRTGAHVSAGVAAVDGDSSRASPASTAHRRRDRRRRIAVIATGLLASQLAGSIAGMIAATFLAFTPVFLYQSIQPMSDVPVTAAWMMCFLLRLSRARSLTGLRCRVRGRGLDPSQPRAARDRAVVSRAAERIVFSIPVAIAGVVPRGRPDRCGTDRRFDRVMDPRRSCLRSRISARMHRDTSRGWSRRRRCCSSRYSDSIRLQARPHGAGDVRVRAAGDRRRISFTPSSTTGRTCASCCRRWRCSRSSRRWNWPRGSSDGRVLVRAPILFVLLLGVTALRPVHRAIARYVQARRSTAARVARRPTSSTAACRRPP